MLLYHGDYKVTVIRCWGSRDADVHYPDVGMSNVSLPTVDSSKSLATDNPYAFSFIGEQHYL
jgi:hypothetical protein